MAIRVTTTILSLKKRKFLIKFMKENFLKQLFHAQLLIPLKLKLLLTTHSSFRIIILLPDSMNNYICLISTFIFCNFIGNFSCSCMFLTKCSYGDSVPLNSIYNPPKFSLLLQIINQYQKKLTQNQYFVGKYI